MYIHRGIYTYIFWIDTSRAAIPRAKITMVRFDSDVRTCMYKDVGISYCLGLAALERGLGRKYYVKVFMLYDVKTVIRSANVLLRKLELDYRWRYI